MSFDESFYDVDLESENKIISDVMVSYHIYFKLFNARGGNGELKQGKYIFYHCHAQFKQAFTMQFN